MHGLHGLCAGGKVLDLDPRPQTNRDKKAQMNLGSGMPLVEVLEHIPEALKQRNLGRAEGGCFKQGG